jgi:hypothetical protein
MVLRLAGNAIAKLSYSDFLNVACRLYSSARHVALIEPPHVTMGSKVSFADNHDSHRDEHYISLARIDVDVHQVTVLGVRLRFPLKSTSIEV